MTQSAQRTDGTGARGGALVPRVLLVGLGGLGSPVASILAQGGSGAAPLALTLLDDDVVEATNLHRQVLYEEADLGRPKVAVAQARLAMLADRTGTSVSIDTRCERLHPGNARALLRDHDLVVEGADNLPTKFLAADAAALEGRPIVHAGVVRWTGWVKAVRPFQSACLRCIFEDLPHDRVETCAEAGVVGPLVGVVGALQAGLLLRLLAGDGAASDGLTRIDARAGLARTARVRARTSCPLCGSFRVISDVAVERYERAPVCSI